MKRYGQVIKLRPELEEKYIELHANVWPGVKAMISECNMRNYSIFLRDGYLFAYFEYVGEDYESDMKKMAQDPLTQEWWDVCKPCQEQIPTVTSEEWWGDMREVFYME